MESGFESQINDFLQKFKAQSIEDEFFDPSSGMMMIHPRNKLDMDYDGVEMTGIVSLIV